MVDFTRPVFSSDRCDLLEFVPELDAEDMTTEKIRAGLIETLGRPASRSPEEELLKYLESEAGHDEKVTAYTDACSALDKNDFLVNAMTMVSLNRKKATALSVFEFPQTLPEDNLEIDPNTRLNPTDCSLITSYVSIAE